MATTYVPQFKRSYGPYGSVPVMPQLAAPTLTIGTPTASTIPVSVLVDANAVGYRFQLATDSAFTQNLQTSPVQTAASGAQTVPYTFTGLTANAPYYVRAMSIGDGTSYTDSGYSASKSATTAGSGAVVKGSTLDAFGQSNVPSAAPIDPETRPAQFDSNGNKIFDPTQSVAYDPAETLSQGILSTITPSLLRQFQFVHIWNVAAQAWQKLEARVNAQGFTSAQGADYVAGFNFWIPLAQWWELNRPGEHLFLRHTGGIGQSIATFLKANGSDYQARASQVWAPSNAALPAYAASLGVTEMHTLGQIWKQGETESDVPNYQANMTQLFSDLYADGYWKKTSESKLLIAPVANRRDLDSAKAAYLAQNTGTITYPPDRLTVLKDNIHEDALTMWRIGYQELPEAFGLAPITEKFFFKGFASTAGNTASLWKDESGSLNHLLGVPTILPALVTDSSTGKKAYTVGAGARTKLTTVTGGGFQRTDQTAKTIIQVIQQPVTSDKPHYSYDNSYSASSPGFTSGSVAAKGSYIGGPQDTSQITVLVYELNTTASTGTTGDGTLTVYNSNTLQGSPGPVILKRFDGDSKISLLSTLGSDPQYDAQTGTYLLGLILYPGVSATRRAAVLAEIASKLPIGTTFAVTPPVNTGEPTGALVAQRFAPSVVGIYPDNAGTYQRTGNPTILKDELATMLSRAYLPAGASGRVGFSLLNASGKNAVAGFAPDQKRVKLTEMLFAAYVGDNGNVIVVENGVSADTGYAALTTEQYFVTRIASTGQLRIDRTSNGTAFTPVFTSTLTSTAALYVPAHLSASTAELQLPVAQGLSLITTPAPGGNFVTQRTINEQDTTGGLLRLDVSDLTLTTATIAFYCTLDMLTPATGYVPYQVLAAIGLPGAASEVFYLVESSGSLSARVQKSAAGSYANVPSISVSAGQRMLVVFRLSQGDTTLNVNNTKQTIANTGAATAINAPFTLGGALDAAQGGICSGATGGAFSDLLIVPRLLSDGEIAQLVTAGPGQLASVVTDAARYFPLNNLLTSSEQVADTIDTSKFALVNSGLK